MTLRSRWAERQARRKQHTFVYCPQCRYELVAGGVWLGQDVTNLAVEAYRCARCGTFSAWDFDAPAPILLRGWPEAPPPSEPAPSGPGSPHPTAVHGPDCTAGPPRFVQVAEDGLHT